MSGRHAAGPELAEKLEGSALARTRMRVVLETIAGKKRVLEACEEFGICEQRFETVRWNALQWGMPGVELKSAGRPRKVTSEADERIAELEAQLQAALVRAEMATTLPRLGGENRKKTLTPEATSEAIAPAPAATGDIIVCTETCTIASSQSLPAAAAAAEIVEPTIVRLRERSTTTAPEPTVHRRGDGHQRAQREDEQATRRRAAETGRRLVNLGWMWRQVADLLHVAGRTLRRWCHDLVHLHDEPPRFLGRRVIHSPREQRNEVIHFIDAFGPRVGMPTLSKCFSQMCPAELDDLLRRYRRVWRERHRQPLRVLHWSAPGRVWAMDYTEPPAPIDGRWDYLLAVRDLATGMQLLWLPVEAATGVNAAQALSSLFAQFGAPLVLKSDNGGHFTCPVVQDLLRAHQVECLFSPPYWPRYNGAIEAGIGALKTRTDARAARAGHPGYWTWDDTAGALLEANTLSRPRGSCEPSPDLAWSSRSTILDDERSAFRTCVDSRLIAEKTQTGSCVGGAGDVWSERAMAREAIRLALEECGYLHYTRRLIPPPIRRRQAA